MSELLVIFVLLHAASTIEEIYIESFINKDFASSYSKKVLNKINQDIVLS